MSNSVLLNAANGLKIVKIYKTTNTVITSWSIYITVILMEKPFELSLRSGVSSMSYTHSLTHSMIVFSF